MGLFDFIFKNRPKPEGRYEGGFTLLNGYSPTFTRHNGEIYESEIVRAAIHTRATHISKLAVQINGAAKPALRNKLMHGPNQLQTWSQFLYRLSTILDIHNTAFIVPIYDQYGEVSGVFVPLPARCEVVQYGGKPYLRYEFNWGEKAAIELENCGVMTRHQYKSDIFGESNSALLPTMDLISIQQQGIQEGVKSAATYRFMAMVDNFTKAEDLAKERKRFTEENFAKDAKGGGLLLFPNTYKNVKQIEVKPWVVDSDEMKMIRTSVFDYFGVSDAVVENRAYGDEFTAFYEGAIEPFAIQFGEVLTRMLYTYRERSNGNVIYVSANRLQYLRIADKLEMSAQLLDRGVLSLNEAREIWNMPPIENGDAHIIRGEYYSTAEKVGEGNDDDTQQRVEDV